MMLLRFDRLQVFSNSFIWFIFTGVIAMVASGMYILELGAEDTNISNSFS